MPRTQETSRSRRLAWKLHVGAITDIGQNDVLRHAVGDGPLDLIERDRRIGLEVDRVWHPYLSAPCWIAGPVFRQMQIEPIIDRRTRRLVRYRLADRDLALCSVRHPHITTGVLLAQLPAILASHAKRVPALFRKAVDQLRLSTFDDPGPIWP